MARSGRLRKHDPIADKIRQAIKYETINDVIKLIRTSDIDITDGEAATPLMHAALYGNNDIVSWLINNGADVNLQDRNGFSALHYSIQEMQMDIVINLLDHDASIDIKDSHGNTPLWIATFNARGKYQFVQLLKSRGADPNLKNIAGRSSMDFASQIGDEVLVKTLKNG